MLYSPPKVFLGLNKLRSHIQIFAHSSEANSFKQSYGKFQVLRNLLRIFRKNRPCSDRRCQVALAAQGWTELFLLYSAKIKKTFAGNGDKFVPISSPVCAVASASIKAHSLPLALVQVIVISVFLRNRFESNVFRYNYISCINFIPAIEIFLSLGKVSAKVCALCAMKQRLLYELRICHKNVNHHMAPVKMLK